MGLDDEQKNLFFRFTDAAYRMVDGPVEWFRKKIVEPNRQDYPWYHQKFRRVPTIDQCYTDDPLCKFEANQQYRRDRAVDCEVLAILRQRFQDCVLYEGPDNKVRCAHLKKQYDEAETNWFIKYGDLGVRGNNAQTALTKQKHRMIWERRHGPVGSGMKEKFENAE